MKDFDVARNSREQRSVDERSFKLGGETFIVRDRIRPDVLAIFDTVREATFDNTTCGCDHKNMEHRSGTCAHEGCDCQKFQPKILDPGSTLAETLEALDLTILGLMENGEDAHERYRGLRARIDDPLTTDDLKAVVEWCVAETTGRPTMSPSVSTAGREQTETPSTEDSSSPVPAAV